MPIYNYTCKSCNETLPVNSDGKKEILCKTCGAICIKKLGATFSNKPISVSDTPGWFNEKIEKINKFYNEKTINTK